MKILSTLLMLAFAALLSACNTVEGAGKDIERAGEKIEQKADEHK
jgi:entericidin A